jgi:hypothetical protein
MLNPNGVIFSTVTQFVEQVGRRLQWKYGELDVLVGTWNGPSAGALQFKPKVGSPHPDYPLMFCTDSQIIHQNALIAEVEVTYQGIIQTSGASSYITPPITTESPIQGSRDFVDVFIQPTGFVGLATGPGGAVTQSAQYWNVSTRSVTVRYIGKQCSVRYQSYPRPTGLKYSQLGLSRVQWTVLSRTYGPTSQVATQVTNNNAQLIVNEQFLQATGALPTPNVGVPPLYAANLGVQIEQRGQWYNCVETYGPTF